MNRLAYTFTCLPFPRGGLFLIILFLFSFIIINNYSSPLYAQENREENHIFNPQDNAYVYVYGGYGYYRWKMMSMDNFADMFTSSISSDGMKFKHEATPYSVKKYGVKTNISFLSLGLDYLGETLNLPTEYDSGRDLEDRSDKRARQLKYLSGLNFGNVSFQFNITRREFDSTITSHGFEALTPGPGSATGIYYYPEKGPLIILEKGDETAWYTTYTDYEAKFVRTWQANSLELGIRYIDYEAPTELRIRYNGEMGDLLMYTENKIVALFFAMDSFHQIAGNFYFRYYLPVNIAGYYYAESDYFEVENKMPLSTDTLSVTASSAGNMGLAYIINHLKIEGGFDYSMQFSKLMLSDAKLKKEVRYPEIVDGNEITAPAGEKANIEATRLEFLWGFYIHASIYF
jgi:hypothetical protein